MNKDFGTPVPPESNGPDFWTIVRIAVLIAFAFWLVYTAFSPSSSYCDNVEEWERAACEREEQAERRSRY